MSICEYKLQVESIIGTNVPGLLADDSVGEKAVPPELVHASAASTSSTSASAVLPGEQALRSRTVRGQV